MSKKISIPKSSKQAGNELLQKFRQQNQNLAASKSTNNYSSRFLNTSKKGAMVMNVRRGK